MSTDLNQNPEQIARDRIDKMLEAAGWAAQSKDRINHSAAKGIAIREYQVKTPNGEDKFVDYAFLPEENRLESSKLKRKMKGIELAWWKSKLKNKV